jgi:hypothetical protein
MRFLANYYNIVLLSFVSFDQFLSGVVSTSFRTPVKFPYMKDIATMPNPTMTIFLRRLVCDTPFAAAMPSICDEELTPAEFTSERSAGLELIVSMIVVMEDVCCSHTHLLLGKERGKIKRDERNASPRIEP